MPIYSPTGFLDITNATLRTSNTECQNLQIGSGNVYVTTDLTSNLVLNLENITNLGNSTSNTMHFTNANTGLVVDSNIVVTGNVTAGSFLGDGSGLTSIPPSAITGTLSQWSDGTNSDVYIVSNVGIGNVHTLTSNTLQVGANLYVRDADANVLTVTGNVAADYFEGDGSKLTGISSTLQAITDSGNVTSNTVQFTNATTGFVTTSNIEVGGALKINTITAAAYHALSAVTAVGASTGDTIQLTNATTGLVTTANVDVGGDMNVTGNLTVLGTRTIVDTDTLRVKDPIIELGKDNPGTGDLGLVMTRPSGSSNVAMIFDESTDTLEIGYTQSNASDTDITMRTAATEPLDVSVNGNVSVGKELTVSGNVEVGTANLFVDTVNSRVGVGTTTPGTTLDVLGNGAFLHAGSGTPHNSNDLILRLGGLNNGGGIIQSKCAIIATPDMAYGGEADYGRNAIHFCIDNSQTNTNASKSNHRISIKPNGLVGIRNANPVKRLHIKGYSNEILAGLDHVTAANDEHVGLGFGVTDGSQGNRIFKGGIFFERKGGNTGRGDLLFCIENTGDNTSEVSPANEIMRIKRNSAVSITGNLSVTGNATFDTDTLFVDSVNDRVGIGTTSPSRKLDVHSSARPSDYPFSIGGTWSNRSNYIAVEVNPGNNITSFTKDFVFGGSQRPNWIRVHAGGAAAVGAAASAALQYALYAEFTVAVNGTTAVSNRRSGDGGISVAASGSTNGIRVTINGGTNGSYARAWIEVYSENGVYW